MSNIAIDVRNVSKIFRIYPDLVRSRIKQYIIFWKKYYQEKTALKNLTIRINKGEVVGLIGPNGAGKTTLLKIIAGISYPTSGEIYRSDRIIAVMALGLGFHPRLTGMENLELAAMMLGMSRKEAKNRRDWIIDFSELGEYIDRPLTTYSTGMRARLSFAVAACQEPDILIIDEALATGDIRFVQKCIKRIHEIVQSGTTAIFVSHNIWSIKKLTKRCILIDRGEILDDGDTELVTDRYYEVMLKSEVFEKVKKVHDFSQFVGTGEIKLQEAVLLNESDQNSETVYSGEPAKVRIKIVSDKDRSYVKFSMRFWNAEGILAFITGGIAGGYLDHEMGFQNRSFNIPEGVSYVVLEFPSLLLAPGDYYMDLGIMDEKSHSGYTSNEQYYFKTHVLEFGVRKFMNPNRRMIYYQPSYIYTEKAE